MFKSLWSKKKKAENKNEYNCINGYLTQDKISAENKIDMFYMCVCKVHIIYQGKKESTILLLHSTNWKQKNNQEIMETLKLKHRIYKRNIIQ